MPRILPIDLEEYPLLLKLRDPEGAIRAMIETQYSIFAAQHESQPSAQLIQDIQNACSSLRMTSDAMSRDVRDMNTTLVRDIREMSQTQKTNLTAVNDVVSKLPVMLAKSHTRGAIGEQCLLDFLKESFCSTDYQLENTASSAHSGDILISKRDYQCLCDAKFYTRRVPKAEVLKLKSDMGTKKVRCGVLVSFESAVAGYTNLDLDVYTDEQDQLCCLAVIGNAKECPAKVEMSVRFLEVIWKKTLNQSPSSSASSYLKEHTRQVFRDLLESTDHLSQLIKDSEQQKKAMDEFHQRLLRTITLHITRIEERIRVLEQDS